MERDEYQRLFQLEDTLWWFRGMREISDVLLRRFFREFDPETRILDAGCGTGGMLTHLKMWGRPIGLDYSAEAIRFARDRTSSPLARGDVLRLPFAPNSFDLVTSFDVLYHARVQDDENALREAARVLRPHGLLLLRVPALDWLRGRHDDAVHTRHRYGKRELESKLQQAGFRILFVSYANFLLLPFALLRRGTESLRPGRRGSEVEPVSSFLNHILYGVMWLEARWIRFATLPLGLSLVAVARKVDG
jgi:SAM-dependent methyltransferase